MLKGPDLLSVLSGRLGDEQSVQSVVLFGSRARPDGALASADAWSDIDLHVITSDPAMLTDAAWARSLAGQDLCLHVVRPASGGVQKVTLLFASGEADLVLLPAELVRAARLAMGRGAHTKEGPLRSALNEFSTMIRRGYRFLKGEKKWGAFYSRVVAEMPGRRLGDAAVCEYADIFLCDLLWVLQRIERGELAAAQRVLHRSLAETNFQLLHESRLRRNLPTFGDGRRVEKLLSAADLRDVAVDSRLDGNDLRNAALQSLAGLRHLMSFMVPAWRVPASYTRLLESPMPR
jgi:hypothetical protein